MNFAEVATLVALTTGVLGLIVIISALWKMKRKKTHP